MHPKCHSTTIKNDAELHYRSENENNFGHSEGTVRSLRVQSQQHFQTAIPAVAKCRRTCSLPNCDLTRKKVSERVFKNSTRTTVYILHLQSLWQTPKTAGDVWRRHRRGQVAEHDVRSQRRTDSDRTAKHEDTTHKDWQRNTESDV